ncbi:MAG: hypothetical protein IPJ88_18385 [Myxococcales bacterium]|nr:MAG: hypothetical protein IPJ88_18385 [Myxococcales bacterium]
MKRLVFLLPCLLLAFAACDDEASPKSDASIDASSDAQGDASADDAGNASDWGVCDEAVDTCILESKGCCDPCGIPTQDELDAVNVDFINEHFNAVCDQVNPNCPSCPIGANPKLSAQCISGLCTVVDENK